MAKRKKAAAKFESEPGGHAAATGGPEEAVTPSGRAANVKDVKARKAKAGKPPKHDATKPAQVRKDDSHYPGKQEWPKHIYGPKGQERQAQDEADLATWKKRGWSEEPSDEHDEE